MTNGRLMITLIGFALTVALAAGGGAIRSYAQQQVMGNRLDKLESEQEDTDEVKTQVTVLATEFGTFKEQYGKDHLATVGALKDILTEVRKN